MNNIWILAQTSGDKPDNDGGLVRSESIDEAQNEITSTDGTNPVATDETTTPPPPIWQQPQFMFLILMFVVMYFMLFRGPKKKQQQHKKMVDSLKTNDRVRTIGGILGTVITVKEDEIILKVDESNNTKIRVIPGAISKLSSDDAN